MSRAYVRLVTFNKVIYVAGTPPRANLRLEGSRHADKEIVGAPTGVLDRSPFLMLDRC